MANPRHQLGLAAEQAVAAWLTSAGWRVVATRQRSQFGGEVDLVAIDPVGTMVAIEVRARRTARTGAAVATVDRRRVARLGRTLAALAATRNEPHTGLRIDLVTAEPEPGSDNRWRLRRRAGIG
jgi:putative endonuclease